MDTPDARLSSVIRNYSRKHYETFMSHRDSKGNENVPPVIPAKLVPAGLKQGADIQKAK